MTCVESMDDRIAADKHDSLVLRPIAQDLLNLRLMGSRRDVNQRPVHDFMTSGLQALDPGLAVAAWTGQNDTASVVQLTRPLGPQLTGCR